MTMWKSITLYIIPPLLFTTIGEFILKFAANNADSAITHTLLGPLGDPMTLLGFACIFIGGILWLVAMSIFEISFMYPFLSVNYVAIIVGSQILFGEQVSLARYLSIVLIMVGLIFISKSPHSESNEHEHAIEK